MRDTVTIKRSDIPEWMFTKEYGGDLTADEWKDILSLAWTVIMAARREG